MEPLVSVIMPVYNSEKFIKETVYSILNQTYKNMELIAVIDAPTDHTVDIIESIHDPRMRLFYNSKNKGISYTTNKGIKEANGKYIALMDHDDIAVPDRLQAQVDFLEEHEEIDILGGANCTIDAEGNIVTPTDVPRFNPKYIKALLHFQSAVHNSTTMMRKDFIDKNHLSYKENCYGMQDFRFFMESSKVGQITSLNKLLNCWRSHEHNTTKYALTVYKEKRKEAYAQCQKDSLKMTGFVLEEWELEFLTRVIEEQREHCCKTKEEISILYAIFNKMVLQAQDMRIDFYDEWCIYLNKLFAEQIRRVKIFWR